MRQILAALLVLVGSVACGDDTVTGPAIPDITGEWAGSWAIVAQGSGPDQTFIECSGSISVTGQTGREFEGSALLDGDLCSFPVIPFDGEVDEDGSVRFTLNLVRTCTITAGSPDFTGSVEGDTLVVTNSVSADCEGGPFSISTAFTGSRAS